MTKTRFIVALVAILVAGTLARTVWLRADPPIQGSVGIVWHDEGPWTHNARNRVLWGHWRTDAWNPVFIAPVFTALEFGSFEAFGVGLWQARLVPVLSGILAIAALATGVGVIAGRRAGLAAAAILAADYTFVMWNRAALMESTMTSCMVLSWASYARAEKQARWGLWAGVAAVLAWFTKAAAASFVAAVLVDAIVAVRRSRRSPYEPASVEAERGAVLTLVGLVAAGALIGAVFVLPHWTEYRFYNWQMSVERKPEYTLEAFKNRFTWLPAAQDIFSRMWLVLAAGLLGLVNVLGRWTRARSGERLLVLWIAIGLLELGVHDSGNARRYVMFAPPFAGLAAMAFFGGETILPSGLRALGAKRWLAFPLGIAIAYLAIGSLLRPVFESQVNGGNFHAIVRLSASLALAAALVVVWQWSRLVRSLSTLRIGPIAAAVWLGLVIVWDGREYYEWARHHADTNYEASLAVGRILPPGTLVQGKLANGLALDNRIRPIFIGNGFGNYDDRFDRPDVRYILTYDLPSLGYESSASSGLIPTLLNHYPDRRVVASFDVDETPGVDRAVLIDKFPNGSPTDARH